MRAVSTISAPDTAGHAVRVTRVCQGLSEDLNPGAALGVETGDVAYCR